MNIASSHGQEVSVVANNDANDALPIAQLKNLVEALGAGFQNLQNNFTLLENELNETQNKLGKVEICNAKFMIYNPSNTMADSDGCTSTVPTESVVENNACSHNGLVAKATSEDTLLTCKNGKWVSVSNALSDVAVRKLRSKEGVLSCVTRDRRIHVKGYFDKNGNPYVSYGKGWKRSFSTSRSIGRSSSTLTLDPKKGIVASNYVHRYDVGDNGESRTDRFTGCSRGWPKGDIYSDAFVRR